MSHHHDHDHKHEHAHKHKHDHEHDHKHEHEHKHVHDHVHDHKLIHGHCQKHDCHNEVKSEMSFEEKMIKLLDHWIRHNDDHAGTYRNWAQQAKENNLDSTAELLNEAAKMTIAINAKFEAALAALTPLKPS